MTLLDVTPTALQALWLILVAVLWIGYLVLEGFDYGVAMLLPFVGKNDKERRVLVNTIGPVWDGNQVWLLTAGGAMFAAFSGWYATLFSALYLPLFLILLGLIGLPRKNVAILGGATTVPLFDGDKLWAGPLFGLFSWFGLVGGITFVLVFLTHGALYAALKTKGEIHDRLMKLAVKLGLITAIPGIVFVLGANIRKMLPGQLDSLRAVAWVAGILLLVLFVGAIFFAWKGREGTAFILTGGTIAMCAVMIFAHLYPGLGFDNTGLKVPLDITTASSSPTTLTLMTVAAAILVPIVLLYQIWTYTVFRRRIGIQNIPDDVDGADDTEPVAVGG